MKNQASPVSAQWFAIKSSTIKAYRYNPEAQELDVEFSGGNCYRYAGFPQDDLKPFLEAESLGSHFAKNIRNKFECKKLTVQEVNA